MSSWLPTAVWQAGRNAALGAAEYMTPVLTESQFVEKGVLTPEEFVKAGDMLVLRCPTWQWQAGDPANLRPFLPPDKQFLFTRNVPCQRRASSLMSGADDEMIVAGDNGEDEWVSAHASHKPSGAAGTADDDDVPDLGDDMAGMSLGTASAAAGSSSAADAAEDGLEELGLEPDDPSALPSSAADNIVRSRTYDVTISYDKYYQCARIWLYGYSEERQPLTSEQVLEDISGDHALKTVTLEAHPHMTHGAGLHASIHPCKHASIMHKLCSEMVASGREVRPDQYLFLFLKFISCVIPTIEYDHTISVDGL